MLKVTAKQFAERCL